MKKQTELPEWMTQTEDYVPSRDKDSFQKKTSGQLLKLLARIRMQTVRRKEKEISAGISLLLLFVTVLLTVCAHGLRFPVTVLGVMIVLLAAFSGKDIRQILAETMTGVGFSLVFTLPAALLGNVYSMQVITTKTAVTVMAVAMLNHAVRWNKICASLSRCHLPDTFLFVFDMTVKYLVVLGRSCKELLDALTLRSVGKNPDKKRAAGGILAVTYLRSQRMAEETYLAMHCRGYDGTYRYYMKHKKNRWDLLPACLLAAEIVLYIMEGAYL